MMGLSEGGGRDSMEPHITLFNPIDHHCESFQRLCSAPDGAQGAIMDVKAVYRGIPVWPQHKARLVVELGGSFWIEHNMVFGLVTAGGQHGQVADATIDIWRSMGVAPVLK
jgi:hypothetical protein